MAYDACIIGAGPDGLACAARLAAAGRKVLLVERAHEAGGPCVTKAFAPGFSASLFADELPMIPGDIFRELDLARRGAIMTPAALDGWEETREALIARVMADAADCAKFRLPFLRTKKEEAFPGEELAGRALANLAVGRAFVTPFDPAIPGSAVAILEGAAGGMPRGGLASLGKALQKAAEAAGAELLFGLEATGIRRRGKRAVAVELADGREIEARAIVSTLDLRRTFLSLFAWNALPKPLVERVAAFRPAPGIARLLVALSALPRGKYDLRSSVLLPCDGEKAYHAWRSGLVPARPPVLLRVVSAVDPSLAPNGCATVTMTLGGIPHRPFDGPWTNEKRLQLQTKAMAFLDEAFPGASATVVATQLIVPPDIENLIGLTDGDLMGGELTAAQMLGFRPFSECRGTRTPVPGLYLAGPSSTLGPIATCASGWAAADAVLADARRA